MTRATDARPTTRVLLGYQGQEYVVELTAKLVRVRLKGSRGKHRWQEIPADTLFTRLASRGGL